ncbi:hypothetical protein [Bradyrhizobium lablabi]|uniref:Uncharacterized protein n=1 Tax=Bradyrhizobium lablabi TaxID=722472 RepID=A0A1H5JHD5_9BRAD|nr:hypothetical protein [Bradyrhizobium lablabi]SEE51926.1 hypothetical protein SAMN05444171_7828 [Bradyrhizobium lablabi]
MSDYRTDTDIGPGLSPGLGQPPAAPTPKPSDDELLGSAFRTQNSFGSIINRLGRGSFTPQPGYNPVDDLKSWDDGEYFRTHGSTFMGSQSPEETQAIKAEIDKGRKDREALAAGGSNGTVAGLAIGLVDPTMFMPVGNAVRLARAATIGGEMANTALSVGKMALMQSTAQEALLQASQPERTLSESAINVGSNTLLAALIGGGAYGLLAKDGLIEKGVTSLDAARVKLSEHNGVREKVQPEPGQTGPAGNIADTVGPESVASAAVKINDKIYTGANHLEAMEKAAAELGTDVENIHTKVDDTKQSQLDAWVTSTGRFIDSKEAAALVNSPHEKLDSSDPEFIRQAANSNEPAGNAAAQSVGAAASDTRNLSPVPYGLDSIPGVGKMVSKMFPNLDVLTNGAVPAKAALSEMVDTPIALMANKEGQTATRFGGPTIERELKQMREGLHFNADQEMLKQWGSYLEQEGGATFIQRQTGRGPADKMTFDDFNAAVYDALSTGDAHSTPQVTAMAQWIRNNGLNPIKDRALASIEGFQETVSRPGETYAPRLWDKDKISANWNDYVSTWTDHLAGEQATKAQAQERIGAYQGALESHRSTIAKYEDRIAKLSEDADVIAARAEETTRINKAANQRAEKLRTRDQDTLPLKNAQGGAVFETLARNRGNLLADRASAKLSEIESLQAKMAAEIQNHDLMRAKIEKEIGDWSGKSAKEAKAALKARAEAEKAREIKKAEGTFKGKEERLTAADKAVDSAVKEILTSDRALDKQELKSRAEEIASRVIGTPEGRLPYDASTSGEAVPTGSDTRGHTARREIDIPYEMAKPWLRRSATEALQSYTHSVLPDALLAERFSGDPNLVAVMKEIESDYAAKRADAKSETAQNKLKSQMDTDMKIIAAKRDQIRGTFGYDPTMQGLARFSQNALKVNNLISSHGMAVASLPDFAGVVFRHGIESAFKDAWIPFANSLLDNEAWQAVKAAGDEWKAFGIGIETHSASRNHALSGISEHYRPNSKFERALTWASDKAFIANLLAPLTDIQKRMATNAVASNILRAAEAVAAGKVTQKQIEMLAAGNITEAQAARIWDQWSNNGGERVKGVILPNMDKWTDKGAALAFRGAVGRDVDIAVVQPGLGEIPSSMSKPGFNVLFQYKKFTWSATQRILISNLQRHDAGTMAGLITAVGMGMLAYRINTMASGQKMATDAPTLFKEGISRGGILGVIDDSNTIASKFTGGKADIYRAIGADKPLSKYVSRDAASVFLGPTWGKVTNLAQITRAATHPSEWNESDTHALRMMTMGTNFPYIPQLFDKVEQGANHAMGIPMKAKPQ